jgi:hypothetical protein
VRVAAPAMRQLAEQGEKPVEGRAKRRMAALFLTLVLLVGSAACEPSKYSEPFNDALRSQVVNDAPARIGAMPDGFTKWALKCDDGFRLYSSGFAVSDPACAAHL